jgi:hypothetical protein
LIAMEMEFDPLTVLTATGVAGYVAIIADCVARDDLGLSNEQIRGTALVTAALIGIGLAANLLARRPDNAK